jgi:hypothetical protein
MRTSPGEEGDDAGEVASGCAQRSKSGPSSDAAKRLTIAVAENAEITSTMARGDRRFGLALRRKTAGKQWNVLGAQSNRLPGALTAEIEANLQQLPAALTEVLQKSAAARVRGTTTPPLRLSLAIFLRNV